MPAESTDDVLPPNYQDYPDGSLLRVVFHNFLIYEHTSFVPSENLNLILGHNGSGKSSIICGICLACGGSPKSLGRSEKPADYIRHGCTEGYVEIAIADKDKGPQVVRLTIRTGKSLEYRLNNSIATQSDINNLRKHYNIQIDNPCAFLAQDKVKSFSEQSSIELLKNTMKAASDDLDKRHKELIEQRKDSATIEEKCASSDTAVKHFEEEIHKITPLVENYKKKMALQSQLRLLEKKKAFLEFEKADQEWEEEKIKVDSALEEYRCVEGKIEDCEKKSKKLQVRLKIERDKIENLKRSADGMLATVQEETDKKMIEGILGHAKSRLESVKKNAKEHERKVVETGKLLEVAEAKLEEATEELSGYDAFLATYKAAEKKYTDESTEQRIEEDSIQKRVYELKQIESKRNAKDTTADENMRQRLAVLANASSDASNAYNYYLKNKKDFKGPVYVPIMDVVLKSSEAVRLVENSISPRDQTIFLCTCREDETRLQRGHPWRISSAVVPAEKIRHDEINAVLPDDLKRLGFQYLISEAVDAPSHLKQYLCNISGLDRIPFGNLDERKLEQISKYLEEQHWDVFMTRDTRFQIKRSEYSRNSLQTQSALRSNRSWQNQCYLVSPVPKIQKDDGLSELVQKLKDEIETRGGVLKNNRRETQKERDQIRQASLEWKSKKQVQTKWNADVIVYKKDLRDLKNETFDIETAEKEYEKAKKSIVGKTKNVLDKCEERLKALVEKYREIGQCSIIESICKSKVAKLSSDAADHRSILLNLQGVKNSAEEHLKEALDKKTVARKNLKSECKLPSLDETEMDDKQKEIFKKLMKLFVEAGVPTELEEVDNTITTERTRLKMAEDNGEEGSEDHLRQMDKLVLDLAQERSKHEKLIQNRDTLHEKLNDSINAWKGEIEKMIEEINNNYIKFFETLGCRGEVSLDIPENPLDIERYGIMIMVCFRKGENLKRLDNKVQSGGERSVATMLYLLALQQLCPVPFRCIDEINQGMDPTNERKVFDIMVGLWNGTSGTLTKTQYFLLSPKLLHGLDMRDNVNVVMVNSTLSKEHSKFYNTTEKLNATFARLGIDA